MDLTKIIIATINPLFGLLGLIFTSLVTFATFKINKKMNSAKESNDATHTLFNSIIGVQLKNAMGLAEKLANITNTPEDIADAVETKRLYDDHMKNETI